MTWTLDISGSKWTAGRLIVPWGAYWEFFSVKLTVSGFSLQLILNLVFSDWSEEENVIVIYGLSPSNLDWICGSCKYFEVHAGTWWMRNFGVITHVWWEGITNTIAADNLGINTFTRVKIIWCTHESTQGNCTDVRHNVMLTSVNLAIWPQLTITILIQVVLRFISVVRDILIILATGS